MKMMVVPDRSYNENCGSSGFPHFILGIIALYTELLCPPFLIESTIKAPNPNRVAKLLRESLLPCRPPKLLMIWQSVPELLCNVKNCAVIQVQLHSTLYPSLHSFL